MYFCEECNVNFDKWQSKANHIRWKHEKFDVQKYYLKQKLARKLSLDKKLGKIIHEAVKCDRYSGCDNIIQIEYRPGKKKKKYFCSRSCANGKPWNENQKDIHLKRMNDPNDNYGQAFKNNSGNILNKKYFSSKNERAIVKYFKNTFITDDWKSGGGTKIDGVQICRDLWSDKLKICFEYDGIWHFKDIHGQLQNKQLKDFLLEKWCIQNGYRLIRVDEEKFINIHQIVNLIYNTTEQIIKIGSRY